MIRAGRFFAEEVPHYLGDRMMAVELRGRKEHVLLHCGYAPGEWENAGVREEFWDQYGRALMAFPVRAFKLGGMDANGEVQHTPPYVGRRSATEASPNGSELMRFCQAVEARLCNTWFGEQRQVTCRTGWGGGEGTWRQIDFVLSDARVPAAAVHAWAAEQWPVQMQESGVVDHYPVVAVVQGIGPVYRA
eukprot:3063427-Alexandrium_andersonii.AAC.1